MTLTADDILLDTKSSTDTLIDCIRQENVVISIQYYSRFAYAVICLFLARKYGRGATISLPLQAA